MRHYYVIKELKLNFKLSFLTNVSGIPILFGVGYSLKTLIHYALYIDISCNILPLDFGYQL